VAANGTHTICPFFGLTSKRDLVCLVSEIWVIAHFFAKTSTNPSKNNSSISGVIDNMA
jgi:hypothetical protein